MPSQDASGESIRRGCGRVGVRDGPPIESMRGSAAGTDGLDGAEPLHAPVAIAHLDVELPGGFARGKQHGRFLTGAHPTPGRRGRADGAIGMRVARPVRCGGPGDRHERRLPPCGVLSLRPARGSVARWNVGHCLMQVPSEACARTSVARGRNDPRPVIPAGMSIRAWHRTGDGSPNRTCVLFRSYCRERWAGCQHAEGIGDGPRRNFHPQRRIHGCRLLPEIRYLLDPG